VVDKALYLSQLVSVRHVKLEGYLLVRGPTRYPKLVNFLIRAILPGSHSEIFEVLSLIGLLAVELEVLRLQKSISRTQKRIVKIRKFSKTLEQALIGLLQ